MNTCVRCGIATENRARCADCLDLGWQENDYWIRRRLTEVYASRCECGRTTWADCDDCRRVGVYLNNQRIARVRAAA